MTKEEVCKMEKRARGTGDTAGALSPGMVKALWGHSGQEGCTDWAAPSR